MKTHFKNLIIYDSEPWHSFRTCNALLHYFLKVLNLKHTIEKKNKLKFNQLLKNRNFEFSRSVIEFKDTPGVFIALKSPKLIFLLSEHLITFCEITYPQIRQGYGILGLSYMIIYYYIKYILNYMLCLYYCQVQIIIYTHLSFHCVQCLYYYLRCFNIMCGS